MEKCISQASKSRSPERRVGAFCSGAISTRETRMNTVALKCRFVTRLTLWRPPSRRLANFYDDRVQNLLKKMTGLNLEKIFARQKEPLVPPVYRLMTSDELAQVGQKNIEVEFSFRTFRQ